MDCKKIALTVMKVNQEGLVVEILEDSTIRGQKMALHLSTLGIRVGARIKKVNQQVLKGPIVVEIGGSQIAVGFGIAKKILVSSVEGSTDTLPVNED